MATAANRIVLTYEHYLELPNDGKRYEIIEGELYVSPAPSMKHQWTTTQLTVVVGTHVGDNDLGHVYTAPCDVVLSFISIVQPDLLFGNPAQSVIDRIHA